MAYQSAVVASRCMSFAPLVQHALYSENVHFQLQCVDVVSRAAEFSFLVHSGFSHTASF